MRRVHRLFSRYSRGFPAPSRRTFFCRRLRGCRCRARAAGLFPCFVPGQVGFFGGCAARNGRAFSRRRRFFGGRSSGWKKIREEATGSIAGKCLLRVFQTPPLSGSPFPERCPRVSFCLAECVLRCLPESLNLRTLPVLRCPSLWKRFIHASPGAVWKGGEGSPA